MKNTTEVWTDGASRIHSRKGEVTEDTVSGYSFLVIEGGRAIIGGDALRGHTNNQMELAGVYRGLQNVMDKSKPTKVVTDSAYIVNTINNGWYKKWLINGWKNSSGKPVANQALWEGILEEWDKFPEIEIKHVKGHSGVVNNELVDTHVNMLMNRLEDGEELASEVVTVYEGR